VLPAQHGAKSHMVRAFPVCPFSLVRFFLDEQKEQNIKAFRIRAKIKRVPFSDTPSRLSLRQIISH